MQPGAGSFKATSGRAQLLLQCIALCHERFSLSFESCIRVLRVLWTGLRHVVVLRQGEASKSLTSSDAQSAVLCQMKHKLPSLKGQCNVTSSRRIS